MRIAGGQARGRRINLGRGYRTRPTSCRIREALFNILPPMEGMSFLDLYAGSGAIGLEALSRGAAKVVFVEKNKALADVIKTNLGRTEFEGRYEILAVEGKRGIRALGKKGMRFDFLFADPPYERGFVRETLRCIGEESLLSEDSLVIIQHSIREKIEQRQALQFILMDQRRYSDTILSFLKLNLKKG
ncbi:MAG: 16S rRNA (guanine(966)-N(2))-methyltransferase RsmD [Syntrophaceae bacterium CG2_30_49_12]|nr:MAG: 16S rRNA (guanine(966)-N(2))-methyltransferase RsmD [Syntrophaceae bacterium CG2_30_49_12]PIP07608.1 MAG: 16S rRNA (guanine(966)-N(2))-methyltransferase RsmD [Syntrophobacterales bacterium CG23_combo_of_CG06-09_8_20_14_all_48_27]PJA49420.1 MAG: 16S rRNA (guanine(966)-N(2))-methyltransferase RsmD [Syntrophobacterales bacterium CG_4_9_14_3_um_filter_49_8]PJC77098.1 MAG: 16S rRNA (guanine(966)-N(2))-methyltransferase RsmD [Syntrophobacterales bacterium CG_4_8_14_3_um_filter_49_14]